jgi:hypothetical protein
LFALSIDETAGAEMQNARAEGTGVSGIPKIGR